jgi:uncharacterized protein
MPDYSSLDYFRGQELTMDSPFPQTLRSIAQLREHYRQPSALVQAKKKPHLDEASQRFVVSSPFLLVGTASSDGAIEVSPRGGPAGWVKVLASNQLLIPDLNGNNLIDSMTNIVANPYVGLLFVHPGKDETLRVNGKAWITIDPQLLQRCAEQTPDGRLPQLPKAAIAVEVTDVFIHCAKAFRRGEVWNPTSWTTLDTVDAIDIIRCQLSIETPKDELLANFAKGYAEELKADWDIASSSQE